MSEKKYIPGEFINTIAYRIPRRTIPCMPSSSMEIGFDTWEDARAELERMRQRMYLDQQKKALAAFKSYNRAKNMRGKG